MARLQIHGYQKKVLVDAGWGDPLHCTTSAKEFLIEKFQGRVISQGSPITWSAHSPDLNPLDLHFWGEAQQDICIDALNKALNALRLFTAHILLGFPPEMKI